MLDTTTSQPHQSEGATAPITPALSPAQQIAYDRLRHAALSVPVTILRAPRGSGKTTLLKTLEQDLGARLIGAAEILTHVGSDRGTEILDLRFRALIASAFETHNLVIVDDMWLLEATSDAHGQVLKDMFHVVEVALFEMAAAAGKHLVMSRNGGVRYQATKRALLVDMPHFTSADYATIITSALGANGVSAINVDTITRRGSQLTVYKLLTVCSILRQQRITVPTTAQFLDCMERYALTSNLKLSDVENIQFSALKGAEDLVKKLDTLVLLPMNEPELAKQLGLTPKRGVLLHGLPGTGKTSIGRALAHRMKGRFFLIDGTIVSEPAEDFFKAVDRVFAAAQANSPAVIFIDDADVLFKTDAIYGFNRYLLTKLDGLASEKVNTVCVMMTAMNVADLPAALLRSGRIDVWLETKLPDASTRSAILLQHAKGVPAEEREFDSQLLGEASEGFTPADLRRLVGDATALLAYDKVKHRAGKRFDFYLAKSIDALREQKVWIAHATKQPIPAFPSRSAIDSLTYVASLSN